MNDLAYQHAETQLKQYSEQSEKLIAEHREATDCRNCEAFLQMGIDSFEWIMRADRAFRLAVYREEIQHHSEAESTIENWCRQWLLPCEFAERWIEMQQTRGYSVDNVEEFRKCVSEMSAIVDNFGAGNNAPMPEPIRVLRDEAISEHNDGQTAEFV